MEPEEGRGKLTPPSAVEEAESCSTAGNTPQDEPTESHDRDEINAGIAAPKPGEVPSTVRDETEETGATSAGISTGGSRTEGPELPSDRNSVGALVNSWFRRARDRMQRSQRRRGSGTNSLMLDDIHEVPILCLDSEYTPRYRKKFVSDQPSPPLSPGESYQYIIPVRLEQPTHTQQDSLPDATSQDSFERFTPEISDDENSETYRFQCTSPGLYQCSVTGLVFNMEGEGDVTYRIVHWDRRLLAQHHKKPAGPLFDIRCQQQSVCQLHLPHCEIRSTGACQFLSVAHVTDEGTKFILPHEITETHVVINITGFSWFGNVKDKNSPPVPIKAAVLLFYTPPVDPDPTSFLHLLLLPGNVVIRDVLYKRRIINGVESYIKTPPHCKLQPNQEYTLSTSPEDESVFIQPKKAEFDNEINDNYFTTFEVILEQIMKNINLSLKDRISSLCVWERRVGLPSAAIRKPQGQSAVGLRPDMSLLSIRSSFISGVSGPVLQSLLDGLLEKQVINDSEREAAHGMQNRADKARFVIDAVRNKGEAARSEMMALLCDIDPFFCGRLGMRSDEDEMMIEEPPVTRQHRTLLHQISTSQDEGKQNKNKTKKLCCAVM